MIIKRDVEGYGILALAVLISFVWHIFWLSNITIVSGSRRIEHVKFSRVSFLGPILGKGAMELRAEPKPMSFLEKRYKRAASDLAAPMGLVKTTNLYERYEPEESASYPGGRNLSGFIDEALAGEKVEPAF